MSKLQGTVEAVGITELLRIPITSRRTGELLVATQENEGRLIYDSGRLVSATMDALSGSEALSEILRWDEGVFEFREGVRPGGGERDPRLNNILIDELKKWYASRITAREAGSAAPDVNAAVHDNIVPLNGRPRQVPAEETSAAAPPCGETLGAARLDRRGNAITKRGDFTQRDGAMAAIAHQYLSPLSEELGLGPVRTITIEGSTGRSLGVAFEGEELLAVTARQGADMEEQVERLRQGSG
ncbi:MAG TPA: DUF4388 domain-containing protein [Deltaproteobacteria bacterium]|nr:DUF4388 domain-containing protein [Deltaproteobacteria bacterium]